MIDYLSLREVYLALRAREITMAQFRDMMEYMSDLYVSLEAAETCAYWLSWVI